MTDFENSVAQQQVEIATEVAIQATVGENFYNVVYITSAAIPITLVTKSSYETVVDAITQFSDVQKARVKLDLAGLFDNAPSVKVYISSLSDYKKAKYKGYFTYLPLTYTDTGALSDDATTILAGVTADSEFTQLVTDVPVVKTHAISETATDLRTALTPVLQAVNAAGNVWAFARGTDVDYAFTATSPALYQIGRTLGQINSTGTPVGNSLDMVACERANVIPTLDTSTDEVVACAPAIAALFEDNNVQYFKPIGNGTGGLASVGGKTLRGTVVGVQWITDYCNFVIRVAVAQLITRMNTFVNSSTYSDSLIVMRSTVGLFVTLGRVENFKVTAPDWTTAKQLAAGDVIVIPNAWEGYYIDNVRREKISGTLYVKQ